MFKIKKHLSKLQVFIFFTTVSITNIYAVSIKSLPITEVELQTAGQTVVQNRSGAGGLNDRKSNIAVNITKVKINDGGVSITLDNFATRSISTKNILDKKGDNIYTMNNGQPTSSDSSQYKAKVRDVLSTTDIRDFLGNDNSDESGGGGYPLVKIMYDDYIIDSDDYLLFQERNGNSPFSLIALDKNGDQISGSVQIDLNQEADSSSLWDTGYDSAGKISGGLGCCGSQKQYFGIFKVSNFNIGSNKVYGFQFISPGADAKFYALGTDSFEPPSTDTPFTCQSESFVSFNTAGSPTDGESKFDIIGLADGKLKKSHVLTGSSGVNSIGYNIKDNFIWGYNLRENKLVKIDANQKATLYDLPADLPADFYISADVDKNGILHLSPWDSSQIYRVNVDSTSDNFLEVLEPLKLEKKALFGFFNISTEINTGDMAFNPQDGYLYYIEKGSNGKVYKVNPSTGLVSFVVDSEVNPNVVICFFDASGNFYFNLGVNKLYRINMNNPKKAEPFGSLDKNLRNGDGARCPNAKVEEITANAILLTRGNGNNNNKTNVYTFNVDTATDNITGFRKIKELNKKFRSLAYKDGKFYTAEMNGDIYSIDIETGDYTRENSMGSIDSSGIMAMDFDDSGNIIYSIWSENEEEQREIRKYNIDAGESTVDFTFKETDKHISEGLAYMGNNKYVASLKTGGVKYVQNDSSSSLVGNGAICLYGGAYINGNKTYFINAESKDLTIYKLDGNSWNSIFDYGTSENTNGLKGMAIAVVHNINSSNVLTSSDCTKAPEDIITFSEDFDFDKVTSVSGKGEVGTIATYANVATINGEDVDLKVEVLSLEGLDTLVPSSSQNSVPKGFKLQSIGEENSVGFFLDQKRSDPKGTEYKTELKFSFIKHGTNTPIEFSFETHVFDIDSFEYRTEYVHINKNDYKFFQTSKDTHIAASLDGNWATFTNSHTEDSKDFNINASVKFVHENLSEFTMKFTHKKNKGIGKYGGKAGFNVVFGSPNNGLPSCNSSSSDGICYATTDNDTKLFIYEDLSGSLPLPSPRVINTTKKLYAEGGAYRAVDGYLYQFTDDGATEEDPDDDKGSNSLWKIDVKTGFVSLVYSKLIDENGENNNHNHVDAAEFYYDQVTKKDTFYVVQKQFTKLHAFNPNNNWSKITGYPKDIKDAGGDKVEIGGLAIDPDSGKAYGVRDFNGHNPILYSLDLTTGIATKLFDLPRVDAEGLSFADDGNLYLETEWVGSGDSKHKIYKLNINDGTLTKVSHSGTKGDSSTSADIETFSCNAGYSKVVDPHETLPSFFNVWDADENINKQVIKTKIVAEDISLTFASLDKAKTAYKETNATDMKVALYSGNNQLTIWHTLVLETATHMNTTFASESFKNEYKNSAFKSVNVHINYKDSNGTEKTATSSDSFAIRPNKFIIALPNNLKAGEDFNLTLKTLDTTNNSTAGYNEVIKSSFDINYTEIDTKCSTGELDLSGITFVDGEAVKEVSYSEVGKLDFNISEIIGKEFALIDQNDTSDAQRLITVAKVLSTEFSAGEFKIENWSLNNGANDFTYYAENAKLESMGAELNATIKAVSMSGKVLENYRSGCYAKDTDLTVNYDAAGGSVLNWKFLDKYGQGNGSQFTIELNSTRFDKGVIQPIVHINFEREKDKAKDPLRLTIKKLDAKDSAGAIGSDSKDESSDFYYGRMNTPDYSNSGRDHNITVYHEVYCKGCDKSKFIYANKKESKDSINWYITTPQGENFTDLKPVNNGLDREDISYNRGLATSTLTENSFETDDSTVIWLEIPKPPLRDRFTYVPPSWLIFNRFKSDATTNSCRINIFSSGEWSGKGKAGTNVDLDVSGKGIRKMDW